LTDLGGDPLNSISKLLLPFHPCFDAVATPSDRAVTPQPKALRRFAPPSSAVPFVDIGWVPKVKSNNTTTEQVNSSLMRWTTNRLATTLDSIRFAKEKMIAA
jgi:hypothetical protein